MTNIPTMAKKLVTILLPAYNEEASFPIIEQCMSQVLEENPNYAWEFLFVNDGSKDNGKTKKVALSYGDKISYYEKENGGVSTALNYGIKKMKGDYFAWLSHDDLIEPKHIEKISPYYW